MDRPCERKCRLLEVVADTLAVFKKSPGHTTVYRQQDAFIQRVAEKLEVEIMRGGVLERIHDDLLWDELKNNLRFGVGLQCPFNSGKQLTKNWGGHCHGATWCDEVEYNTGLKGRQTCHEGS
jgi:hypothetical protein